MKKLHVFLMFVVFVSSVQIQAMFSFFGKKTTVMLSGLHACSMSTASKAKSFDKKSLESCRKILKDSKRIKFGACCRDRASYSRALHLDDVFKEFYNYSDLVKSDNYLRMAFTIGEDPCVQGVHSQERRDIASMCVSLGVKVSDIEKIEVDGLEDIAKKLGLNYTPFVYSIERPGGIACALGNAIIVNRDRWDGLSCAAQQYILRHECAHLVRHDGLSEKYYDDFVNSLNVLSNSIGKEKAILQNFLDSDFVTVFPGSEFMAHRVDVAYRSMREYPHLLNSNLEKVYAEACVVLQELRLRDNFFEPWDMKRTDAEKRALIQSAITTLDKLEKEAKIETVENVSFLNEAGAERVATESVDIRKDADLLLESLLGEEGRCGGPAKRGYRCYCDTEKYIIEEAEKFGIVDELYDDLI